MSLKKAKLPDLINYRLRVVLLDSRQLVGTLLAFDKHMNLVLSQTEEYQTTKKSNNLQKKVLGLVILRGQNIISLSVEAPPNISNLSNRQIPRGPGTARPFNPSANAPTGPSSSMPPAGPSSLAGPLRSHGMNFRV